MIELRIEQILEERGQTFYWLAKETGIRHTSLWRLRHGEAKGVNFDFLGRICRALECQPGDILVWVDDSSHKSTRKVKGK